ncbi:TPA: ATP-binding protein, partial [Haemophilus influenzae]
STSLLLALDDLSLLKKINAYQQDLNTGKSGLTYAGLLMFGKLDIIRSLLPHYLLEYKSKETDHRYDDRITCDELDEGNLFEFYLKVAPKLFNLAKNKHFTLDQLTRSEDNLITGALREAFINMLTHSDYLNDRVTLKISQTLNMLNFENPGVMLVSILEAQSGKKSICRNAILHNMFRRIGLCEREGKGIETIFSNYRKELLTTPVLSTDSEKTLLTLTLQDSSAIQASQQLQQRLGAQYQNLDNDLHKKILLLTALNGGWIKHSILSEKLEKDCHSRDITLALPALERKGLLLGKGEKKDKFYVLPWVDVGDLKEIYGKRHEVTLNTQLSFNVEGLVEEANLEANSEANSEAN